MHKHSVKKLTVVDPSSSLKHTSFITRAKGVWEPWQYSHPMRFIQLPRDSPQLYVSKSSHKVIHPGLIGTTKKLCYSQTGKLESPDLKVGWLLHANTYEIYSTSWWLSTTLCIQIKKLVKTLVLEIHMHHFKL